MLMCVGAGSAVMDMGVGEDAGVGEGERGIALSHYVIYRIYIFNKYCCLPS